MENFIGTKSLRKILEGLKRKFGIFIGTKNIFNPNNKQKEFPSRKTNKFQLLDGSDVEEGLGVTTKLMFAVTRPNQIQFDEFSLF